MTLDNFLHLLVLRLKFLEVDCVNQMNLHEDFVGDSEEKSSTYNSVGFILASIRDILKEFDLKEFEADA